MKSLSIITINYNNSEGLAKTIESVGNQTFTDYEFIIIDGGSTDDSLAVIEKNNHCISGFVSEKDNGIYHAMNKGIKKASGKYCLFLNSGDYLADSNVLADVFANADDADILYGNIIKVKPHYRRVIKYSSMLSFFDFYQEIAAIHHQASFIKRELFSRFGLYREDLPLNADWDFFFRVIIQERVKTSYVDRIISVFDGTGLSESLNRENPINIEARNYKDTLIQSILPDYILTDYKRFDMLFSKKTFFQRVANKLSYFSLKR